MSYPNVASLLLNQSENEKLFSLLGRKCATLASAVVQLYTSGPSSSRQWNKTHCGVACFVKDNPQRSYYIRIYNVKEAAKIWEQEMYNQFCYITPRPYFHTFEANDYQAGLSFADEQEAAAFFAIVHEKMQLRHQRKQERKQAQKQQSVRAPGGAPPLPPSGSRPLPVVPTVNITPPTDTPKKEKNSINKLMKRSKKKSKKKLTKEEIGTPSNFQHVDHVGFDPNTGFDTNTMDPHLKSLFDIVGISETQLQDESTSKLIYDVIAQHGGVEGVRNEMQHRGPLPPMPRKLPPVPSTSPATIRRPICPAAPTPPPQRGVCPGPPPPPPPPPTGKMRGPPPPPTHAPPNSTSSAPPPPPPPMTKKPTMQQSNNDDDMDAGEGRSALLQQIRGGMTLKQVDQTEVSSSQIQEDEPGIAGALMKALEIRNKVIHSSGEDDSDDDEDDDDEWED
uniref:actin nucleation-promoting factor WASL-like n=1 Tax=Myxine glutinosa TaxID=7769 RepID=UPI00358E0F61